MTLNALEWTLNTQPLISHALKNAKSMQSNIMKNYILSPKKTNLQSILACLNVLKLAYNNVGIQKNFRGKNPRTHTKGRPRQTSGEGSTRALAQG
jgi:hypothetical protein